MVLTTLGTLVYFHIGLTVTYYYSHFIDDETET